jgi:hypothetical protein
VIKEVLDPVQDRLLLTLADVGSGRVPSFGLGQGEVANMDTTPRVIWVPMGGPISVANKNGGDGMRNPGALWHRTVQVNAHIWADDVTEAEVLANHLVAALHWVAVGSYAVTSETWDTKGTTDEGVLLVLEIQLRMPFTRESIGSVRPNLIPPLTTHIEAQ